MITITLTGTLEEIAKQAYDLTLRLTPPLPVVTGYVNTSEDVEETPTVSMPKGKRTRITKPGSLKSDALAERIDSVIASSQTAPPKALADDMKTNSACLAEALDLLRVAFAEGGHKADAVNAIAKKFGVKKLGQVLPEQGPALLEAAKAI
jgi:hypothetical protein